MEAPGRGGGNETGKERRPIGLSSSSMMTVHNQGSMLLRVSEEAPMGRKRWAVYAPTISWNSDLPCRFATALKA